MPGGLEPSDRKLLIGAGAIALLLVAGTFALAPPARDQQSGVPSSYASSSGGALAAYLLLVNLHYDVHRWEEPPAQLENRGSNAVLILAEPSDLPTDPERHALRVICERRRPFVVLRPRTQSVFSGRLTSLRFSNLAGKNPRPGFPALSRTMPTPSPSSLRRDGAS